MFQTEIYLPSYKFIRPKGQPSPTTTGNMQNFTTEDMKIVSIYTNQTYFSDLVSSQNSQKAHFLCQSVKWQQATPQRQHNPSSFPVSLFFLQGRGAHGSFPMELSSGDSVWAKSAQGSADEVQ